MLGPGEHQVHKGRRTTIADGAETERPEDLVKRKFVANAQNQLWVADLTDVRTFAGWVYVAFVLDVSVALSLAGRCPPGCTPTLRWALSTWVCGRDVEPAATSSG